MFTPTSLFCLPRNSGNRRDLTRDPATYTAVRERKTRKTQLGADTKINKNNRFDIICFKSKQNFRFARREGHRHIFLRVRCVCAKVARRMQRAGWRSFIGRWLILPTALGVQLGRHISFSHFVFTRRLRSGGSATQSKQAGSIKTHTQTHTYIHTVDF